MTCTNCPAFKICPEKPTKEDYADENKYLIDLECGVWSCQKTIEKLCKENKQLKAQIKKMKNHTNCKFYHEWNLANVMEEPLDDLSPCQGCKNFNKWRLSE